MQIDTAGLSPRKSALFKFSISGALGIFLSLSAVALARADTISLSCLGNGYVRLVWLNLDKGEVQMVMGLTNSAYGNGDAVADALSRAQKGELQTYPLAVTGDTYKWTAYNGANVPIVIYRMTGALRGADFSEQCSKSAINPPAPKF